MTTINAEDLILGRLAANIAKRLLDGEKIDIVNAEKAVMTGSKDIKSRKFNIRLGLTVKGNPHKGPKYSNRPEIVMRYAIRGMLPTERASGRAAFRRLKVYTGLPDEFANRNLKTIPNAKCMHDNFVYLNDICKMLGAKV